MKISKTRIVETSGEATCAGAVEVSIGLKIQSIRYFRRPCSNGRDAPKS